MNKEIKFFQMEITKEMDEMLENICNNVKQRGTRFSKRLVASLLLENALKRGDNINLSAVVGHK